MSVLSFFIPQYFAVIIGISKVVLLCLPDLSSVHEWLDLRTRDGFGSRCESRSSSSISSINQQ